MPITYILNDAASIYNGRKCELVSIGAGVVRTVKVCGTNIRLVTTLWHLRHDT
jgi:hypothetical protein